MKEQNQSTKIGKTVGIILGIIAAVFSYYTSQKFFIKNDIESELKKVAVELNKKTPMEVDEYSRLDSVSTIGKTNFIYNYTLFGLNKAEVNLDTVNKYIRPSLIENIKNNPDLKIYRDNKITIDYKYYDRNGVFVTEISVTPELYE